MTRTADAFEIGGDLAPDIAAIKIVEPGMRQMRERGGERLLLQDGADRRRLAVDEKLSGKARHVLQPGKMSPRQPRLAAGHRIAVAGLRDGRRQQHIERQFSAVGLAPPRSASIQPPTAPGTVSAASGPRGGIVSYSR